MKIIKERKIEKVATILLYSVLIVTNLLLGAPVNNNGTTINNTQNFYEKNATPYEEQKQARQQLRRLAYGL